MDNRKFMTCLVGAVLLGLGGCATSALEEQKRQEMEADIDEILSQELDPAEVGEPKPCLSDIEYRNYRALGKRHLLFEGRQGLLWVNVLRSRCVNLSRDSIFVMKPQMGGRLCELDRFQAVDSMSSLSNAAMAPSCVLGEFRPITEAQVEEIENRLEMR